MNARLGTTILTGGTGQPGGGIGLDTRTLRQTPVRTASQVTRSPAEVFAFAETNSWLVNIKGAQAIADKPRWPADCDLSGKCHIRPILLGGLEILPTHGLTPGQMVPEGRPLGQAFATYHRPKKGDLNTGYSFASMLDGHVRKITVADQLRRSRRVPGIDEGELGPGGNLALAWPIDVPPPGGWQNQ